MREYDFALADYTAIIEGDIDFIQWGAGNDNALSRSAIAPGPGKGPADPISFNIITFAFG